MRQGVNYHNVAANLRICNRSLKKKGGRVSFELLSGTMTASSYIYTSLTYDGAPYTVATGINNSGTIVGYYRNPDGRVIGFLATPIPEPGQVPEPFTIAFLGVSLVGLAGVGRKHFST
jgi:hypothetical protein